jgi:hypothetical protein
VANLEARDTEEGFFREGKGQGDFLERAAAEPAGLHGIGGDAQAELALEIGDDHVARHIRGQNKLDRDAQNRHDQDRQHQNSQEPFSIAVAAPRLSRLDDGARS